MSYELYEKIRFIKNTELNIIYLEVFPVGFFFFRIFWLPCDDGKSQFDRIYTRNLIDAPSYIKSFFKMSTIFKMAAKTRHKNGG
jgi:hypothetical protein